MRKGFFRRLGKALLTGGASEVVGFAKKNKRLAKAILSGGASEVVGNKRAMKAILTGGGSEISRSAAKMYLSRRAQNKKI